MITRTTVNDREILCLTVAEMVTQYHAPIETKRNAALLPKSKFRPEVLKQRGLKDWYGPAKSQEDVEAAVTTGWHEGASRVEQLAQELAASIPPAKDMRRKRRMTDDGDDLDTDRALRGDWDVAWETFRRTATTGTPAIELVFNWGFAWSVTAEQLFWQGAVACVLTDLLEGAGYRVGLTGIQAISHPNGADGVTVIRVKDSGESMGLSDLAAFTAHAGVYRTYGFRAIMEHSAKVQDNLDYPEYDNRQMREDVAESGFLSGSPVWLGTVTDRYSALAAVRDVLSQLDAA